MNDPWCSRCSLHNPVYICFLCSAISRILLYLVIIIILFDGQKTSQCLFNTTETLDNKDVIKNIHGESSSIRQESNSCQKYARQESFPAEKLKEWKDELNTFSNAFEKKCVLPFKFSVWGKVKMWESNSRKEKVFRFFDTLSLDFIAIQVSSSIKLTHFAAIFSIDTWPFEK